VKLRLSCSQSRDAVNGKQVLEPTKRPFAPTFRSRKKRTNGWTNSTTRRGRISARLQNVRRYFPGFLLRRHRVPSDFLVYDLQFRLRCSHCNAGVGFRITIFDNRTRGDNSKPQLERAIVAGE